MILSNGQPVNPGSRQPQLNQRAVGFPSLAPAITYRPITPAWTPRLVPTSPDITVRDGGGERVTTYPDAISYGISGNTKPHPQMGHHR